MTDISIFIKAQNEASAALQSVKGDLAAIEQQSSSLTDTLKQASADLKKAGTALSLGVTAPIVGVAGAAIKSAADFEASMNVLKEVTGSTADDMAKLQAQALQLGVETSFSAGQAAEAMLELGKAGLSAEQVSGAIAGTMDLAAAGGIDLADAAMVAANAVNAFGLNASDAVSVADMLAAAANNSSTDVYGLAMGMKQASAVFASSEQSLGDLTTAMALMANAGVQGRQAGTSLKTMLMRLTAPTDEARAELEALGVSMFDAAGNTRQLPEVLAELQAALFSAQPVTVTSSNLTKEQADRMEYLKKKIDSTQTKLADYAAGIAGVAQSEEDKIVSQDRLRRELEALGAEYEKLAGVGGTTSTVMREMTDASRAAALTTIFGADAIRAVNILMAAGEEGWNAMSEAVSEQGAATRVADARMKGMAGAMLYAKGSLDSLMISTVLPFLDTLGGFVRQVADAASWFGTLDQSVKNAAISFALALAAAGPVLLILSGLAGALAFLLSPLGLVVAGVAALAAAWQLNFAGIQDLTAEAVRWITPYLQEAYDWLANQIPVALDAMNSVWSEVWQAVTGAAGAAWSVVQPYLSGAYDWLQANIPAALETMRGLWSTVWQAVTTATANAFNAIWPLFLGAVGWLQVALPVALASLSAWWSIAWSAVQSVVESVWSVVQPLLQKAYDWLQTDGPSALTTLQEAWSGAWTQVQSAVDSAWLVVDPILTSIYSWFQTDAPGVLTSIQATWSATWTALQESVDSAWSAIQPSLQAARNWLQTDAPAALTTIQAAWSGAWSEIQSAFGAAWSAIGPALAAVSIWLQVNAPAALATFQNAWSSAWPAVQESASSALAVVQEKFGLLSGWMSTDGPSALASLQETWTSTLNALNTVAAEVMAQLEALFTPGFERLKESFGGMGEKFAALAPKFQELLDAAQGMWNSLQPILTALATFIGGVLVVAGVFGVNMLGELFNSLATIVGAAVDQITLVLNTISTVLDEAVKLVQAVIEGDWSAVWQSAKNILAAQIGLIGGTLVNLWVGVSAAVTGLKNAIVNTLKDFGIDAQPVLDEIAAWWDGAWSGLTSVVQTVSDGITAAQEALTGFSEWVAGFSLPDALGGWSFEKLAGWEWPDFPTLPEVLTTLVSWVWPTLTLPDLISDLVNWEWPTWTEPDWLGTLIAAVDAVRGFAGGAGQALGGAGQALNDAASGAVEAGGNLIGDAGQAWNDLMGQGGGRSNLRPVAVGAGRSINITVQSMSVRSEQDIHSIAYQLSRLVERG